MTGAEDGHFLVDRVAHGAVEDQFAGDVVFDGRMFLPRRSGGRVEEIGNLQLGPLPVLVGKRDEGGHDGDDGRGLRYLEWMWDPDPDDTSYIVDYAFMMRAADGTVEVVHDRHVEGLFGRDDWLSWLGEAGFEAKVVPFDHSELEPGVCEFFVGHRPRADRLRSRHP